MKSQVIFNNGDHKWVVLGRDSEKKDSVIDTNDCHLQISIDENTDQITVVSVLDNLIKGASGQAIQNMNLMCGWDQTLGLVDQK